MDMLTDTQLLVMRLATEYDIQKRKALLYAHLDDLGLPFDSEILHDLTNIIREAYQLGVDQAY